LIKTANKVTGGHLGWALTVWVDLQTSTASPCVWPSLADTSH